jgi:hypothetical protein
MSAEDFGLLCREFSIGQDTLFVELTELCQLRNWIRCRSDRSGSSLGVSETLVVGRLLSSGVFLLALIELPGLSAAHTTGDGACRASNNCGPTHGPDQSSTSATHHD